jgi:hypothetical protein
MFNYRSSGSVTARGKTSRDHHLLPFKGDWYGGVFHTKTHIDLVVIAGRNIDIDHCTSLRCHAAFGLMQRIQQKQY